MSRPERSVSRLRRAEAAGQRPALPGCVVGQVVDVAPTGQVRVEFGRNMAGPLPARTVLDPGRRPAPGTPVLLVFEDGDPLRPIILGYPQDGIAPGVLTTTAANAVTEQDLVLTAKSLVVNAGREIVLRCGHGSVTLRADGTVVVRGTRLLSRSSGTNRIKGAAVRIN